MNAGVLYLAPVLLGDADPAEAIPSGVQSVLRNLRCFIAEEPKAARAFLKAIGHPGPLADLAIDRLAADATPATLEVLLACALDLLHKPHVPRQVETLQCLESILNARSRVWQSEDVIFNRLPVFGVWVLAAHNGHRLLKCATASRKLAV